MRTYVMSMLEIAITKEKHMSNTFLQKCVKSRRGRYRSAGCRCMRRAQRSKECRSRSSLGRMPAQSNSSES